jgi:hypothetical protein
VFNDFVFELKHCGGLFRRHLPVPVPADLAEEEMSKLLTLLALVFVLVGCGGSVTGRCDYSDPVGICASAHDNVGGGK